MSLTVSQTTRGAVNSVVPKMERQIVDRVIMELGGKSFWYLTLRFEVEEECWKEQ